MTKKRLLLKAFSLFASVLALTLLTAALSVSAAVSTDYRDSSETNINAQNYGYNWASPERSYLTPMIDGGLMRFEAIDYYSGSGEDKTPLPYQVEYYNSLKELTGSREIPVEMPIFGGFYSSSDSYFIVTGQSNKEEDGSKEVFRITRYDKSWNRLSSSSIYGADTYIPFDAGSLRTTEYNGRLIFRTAHEMFDKGDGLHHQSNFTIIYNLSSSSVERYYTFYEGDPFGYASHSFNQFVKTDGQYVVSLDHGDAYPRSVVLSKKDPSYFGTYSGWDDSSRFSVLSIPGDTGENNTGLTLGGFELSSDAYLVAGSKIDDLTQYNNRKLAKNVFMAAVSRDLSGVSVKQITYYPSDGMGASNPRLVKINNNRFILLWGRYDPSSYTHGMTVDYVELDAWGNTVGSVHSFMGDLSDCQPVISNNKVVWYTWQGHLVTFYEISLNDTSDVTITELKDSRSYVSPHRADKSDITDYGSLGYKLLYQVNQSGTLYVYGSGTTYFNFDEFQSFYNKYAGSTAIKNVIIEPGVTYLPLEFDELPELESVVLPDGYEEEQSLFSHCEKLRKVVLPNDWRSIPWYTFNSCTDLEEVTIPSGVTNISDCAFLKCESLKKIDLPASLTSINEQAFCGCASLKTMTLPAGLAEIEYSIFEDCSSLESINIPAGIRIIPRKLFRNCSSLKSIELPKGITEISDYAFAGCASLQSVTLPDTLQSIGNFAFFNCTGLKVITLPKNTAAIGNYSLGYTDSQYSYSLKKPFIIRGKKGSAAESYAADNSIGFIEDKPLANDSKLSGTSIRLGQTMTVTPGASGGAGYYRYSVYSKITGDKKWTAQKINITARSVAIKPVHSGKHYVLVRVRDMQGKSSERVMSFDVYAPLKNKSLLSSKTVKLGKTIVVIPKASGGLGSYSYTVKYKKESSSKWAVLKPDPKDGKLRLRPSAAVKYSVRVTVKDSRGVSISKTLSLTVQRPLTNKSVISAEKVQSGGSIKLIAKAAGGSGGNRYAFYYKKASSSKWVTLKDYSTKTTVLLKPKASTLYDICIKVRDSSNTIEKRYFKLTVFAPLKNLSTVTSSVRKGEKVRIVCKASGGTKGYTYGVYYKKASAKDWKTLVNYSSTRTAAFRPASAVKYNVCIIVRDSSGNIMRKYYDVNVRA